MSLVPALSSGGRRVAGWTWEGTSVSWNQAPTSVFQDNSWQLYTVQVQTEAIGEGR